VNHSPIVRGAGSGMHRRDVRVRMRHRQHERLVRLEDPVNLSKESFEVVDAVDVLIAKTTSHDTEATSPRAARSVSRHWTWTSDAVAWWQVSAMRSTLVFDGIDFAPARANATELNHGEMLRSMARRPSPTLPQSRFSSSPSVPGP
jgi:hypothetical protein